jgi:hypothetical protein
LQIGKHIFPLKLFMTFVGFASVVYEVATRAFDD